MVEVNPAAAQLDAGNQRAAAVGALPGQDLPGAALSLLVVVHLALQR